MMSTATCQNQVTQASQAGLVKMFFSVPNANQFTSSEFGHFLVRKADVQANSPATLTIFAMVFIGLMLRKYIQKS